MYLFLCNYNFWYAFVYKLNPKTDFWVSNVRQIGMRECSEFMTRGVEGLTQEAGQKLVPPKKSDRNLIPPIACPAWGKHYTDP